MPGGNHSSNYHDLVNGLGQLILWNPPSHYSSVTLSCYYWGDIPGRLPNEICILYVWGVITGRLPNEICILYVWGVITGRLPNEICILYAWGIPIVTDF